MKLEKREKKMQRNHLEDIVDGVIRSISHKWPEIDKKDIRNDIYCYVYDGKKWKQEIWDYIISGGNIKIKNIDNMDGYMYTAIKNGWMQKIKYKNGMESQTGKIQISEEEAYNIFINKNLDKDEPLNWEEYEWNKKLKKEEK